MNVCVFVSQIANFSLTAFQSVAIVQPAKVLGKVINVDGIVHTQNKGLTEKRRKPFKPKTLMTRLNWNELNADELDEDCFWLRADDQKFQNSDLFEKLKATFGHKKIRKAQTIDLEKKDSIEVKLKVLDKQTAQKLSKCFNTKFFFFFCLLNYANICISWSFFFNVYMHYRW